MESNDRCLIVELSKSNFLLKKLYDEHEGFEDQLSAFENKYFLTSEEQMKARRLKKEKLLGVDQMMRIIAVHKAYA